MSEPLDDAYFKWLYSHVASVRDRVKARTYWNLLQLLHEKEFVWFIPNDDNRMEEGRDLRIEFLNQGYASPGEGFEDVACSMLEMLIAFSNKISLLTEGEPRAWFWHMIQNLNLEQKTDAYSFAPRQAQVIDEVLDRVIWRTYDANGHGGLFPLTNPKEDQTKVELWYQVNAYLLERE